MAFVALNVLVEFLHPELTARLWISCKSTASVAVPEAPVYENHSPIFRQDDIRSPGKIAAVQAEAVAKPVQDLPNRQLGFRVPPLDRGHVTAAHRRDRYLLCLDILSFSHRRTTS